MNIGEAERRAIDVGAAVRRVRGQPGSCGVMAQTLMEVLSAAETNEQRGGLLSLFLAGFEST